MKYEMDDAWLYEKLDDILTCDERIKINAFNGEYRRLKGLAMNALVSPFTQRIGSISIENHEYFSSMVIRMFEGKKIDYFTYNPIEGWVVEDVDCVFKDINHENRFGNSYLLDFRSGEEVFSSRSRVAPTATGFGTNPRFSVLNDSSAPRNLRGVYLSSMMDGERAQRVHEIFIAKPAKSLDELLEEIGDWPLSMVREMLPSVR